MLLFASLPFELRAGVMVSGLTFTNLEIVALAALGLWAALLCSQRRLPQPPRWLALGSAGLLLVLLAAALAAGEWRGAALKFTARQVQGALIGLCLADQLRAAGWPLLRRLALALGLGAAVSAALGLLELAELGPALALLDTFKEQPTLAGGLLRLSATFVYANIAAMYYEAVMPLLLAALALARRAWLPAAAALLLYVAALLTYSRAALLTASLAAALLSLAALGLRRRLAGRVALVAAALPALGLAALLLSPSIRVRLAEPDVDRWYRAEYRPAAIGALAPGAVVASSVTLVNRGLVAWQPGGLRPVALAYHWLDARTRRITRYNGDRTPLPAPIAPGESVTLSAIVQAPAQPGDYLLAWDLVVEQSGWFSERGNSVAELPVTVAGAPVASRPARADPPGAPTQLRAIPPPPARRQLWAAALQLWRQRPLLGIGPDVFRHVYGPQLGLSSWDDRIHTNNLYLELLVGAGPLGLAAFLGLAGAALVRYARLLRASGPLAWAALGGGIGLLTFLIHGTLDMFLEYSPTYLLLWALIGAPGGLEAMEATP